jgi:hypothetical protein
VQLLGDLCERTAIELVQLDALPLTKRQGGERLGQPGAQPRVVARRLDGALDDVKAQRALPHARPPQRIARGIPCDGEQPGHDGAAVMKAAVRADDRQKRRLQQLVGERTVSDEAREQTVEPA